MQCPTQEELAACLLGKVPAGRAEALMEHADECERCGNILDNLDTASDLVTDALRNRSDKIDLSDSCTRMMDRAESFVQGEQLREPAEPQRQHLLQGTRVRDYEIIRPIGEGGMGAVFLARHSRLNRDVALKVLSLRRIGDKEAQQRFEQEMSAIGKLQHAGIVRALDAGEHEGIQYLVMELLDGADLRQIVDAVGPIPIPDACEIGRQAAVALHYAHSQQLIHRDIKPSNIMLVDDGTVKVMDLGLAKFTDQNRSLTSTQQAMGSLDFMAPEQLKADTIDQRADVYALGCTLYFMLMGEPPEKRRTAALMVSRSLRIEALRDLLPPPLTRLLQSMLANDPSKRATSLADVADQLAPFCNRADLGGLATKASSLVSDGQREKSSSITSAVDRPKETSSPGAWIGLLVGGLLLAAVVYFASGLSRDSARELSSLPSANSNIEPTREIPLFQLHTDAVLAVGFCEETAQLICGSNDGSISIRDLPDQKQILQIQVGRPIIDLDVARDSARFVALDQNGTLFAFDLPTAKLAWRKTANDFPSKPQAIAISAELIDVEFEGSRQFISLSNGAIDSELPDAEPPVSQAERLAANMRIEQRPIQFADMATPRGPICVTSLNRARLLQVDDLDGEHFIYAEHTHPISAMMAFPNGSLFFTGDQSGEIRVWHAPHLPRSDMLLSCSTRIDSVDLTYEIHRQHKWSGTEFSPPQGPGQDGPNGNTIEIQRDRQRHVLTRRSLSE